jgi:hypothetical protein
LLQQMQLRGWITTSDIAAAIVAEVIAMVIALGRFTNAGNRIDGGSGSAGRSARNDGVRGAQGL